MADPLRPGLLLSRTFLLLSLVLLAALPAVAAPARSLVRVETRFLKAPGLEEYPKARALYLEDEIGFELLPDGHTVYEEHDAIKVLNAEGVDSFSVLARLYRAGAESVEVLEARTILQDGTVLDVPGPAIQDRPLLPGSALYGDRRALRIDFPKVQPGSVVEFRLRTRRAPRPDGRWWAASYVQNLDPLLLSSFTVRVPEGTKFSWQAPGLTPSRPRESSSNGTRLLSWEVRNSPSLEPESAMPPVERYLSRVEVTNFTSWPEVGTWFGDRWETAVADAEGLDILAAGVASTSNSEEQRLQAVLEWAAGKYAVQEDLAESWEPHPARLAARSSTLSPTDMAVLLAAMLQRVGLSARPVLASPVRLQDLEREQPQPEAASRVVLSLPDSRGGSWWIDPASPGELLREPPAGVQEVGAILVEPQSSRLLSTPGSLADDNLRDVRMEIRVQASGQGELTMALTSEGVAGALWRALDRELAETPAREREQLESRLFQNLAQGFLVNGRLYSHYFPAKADPQQPFQVAVTMMVPEMASPREDGTGLAMPLPLYGGDRLAALADPDPRNFPVRFDFPFRDDVRIHVTLPPGSQVRALPGNASLETAQGSYFCTTRVEANQVWFYSRLTVRQPWVSPEAFTSLRRLAAAQTASLTSPLVFTPPAPAEATP